MVVGLTALHLHLRHAPPDYTQAKDGFAHFGSGSDSKPAIVCGASTKEEQGLLGKVGLGFPRDAQAAGKDASQAKIKQVRGMLSQAQLSRS